MRLPAPLTMLTLPAAALLAISGCKPEATPSVQNRQTPAPPAHPDAPAAVAKPAAIVAPARPQALQHKDDLYEFDYKWPAEAAAIPDLNNWFTANGRKIERETKQQARSDQAEAKKSNFPYNPYSYQEDFKTLADTPRMLVLLSDGYTYSGGAHGMPVNTAVLWDRQAQKRIATAAIIDVPRLVAVGKRRFCAALDKARAEKRGAQGNDGMLPEFTQCVDMAKELILPFSKGGKTLDTIRFQIGPYDAGPYAEGNYVIDLPVDAVLMTAVKSPYRDAFAAGTRLP